MSKKSNINKNFAKNNKILGAIIFAIIVSIIAILVFAHDDGIYEFESENALREGGVKLVESDYTASGTNYIEFDKLGQPINPCYVLIYGDLYNMRPAINQEVRLLSITGEGYSNVHTEIEYDCYDGSTTPTDLTSLFEAKHKNVFGCFPNISSYYAGPANGPQSDKLTPVCKTPN